MKNIFVASAFIAFILLISCKKMEELNFINSAEITNDTTANSYTKEKKIDKTTFKDRAEELIYIREYLEYKLPLIMIKEDAEYVKKAQYELIAMGQNPDLSEAARKTISYNDKYKYLMSVIIEDNWKFRDVKYQLENNGDIKYNLNKYPKVIPDDIPNGGKKLVGDKIYGDFNGDGSFEYAYRVMTEKGDRNPVEDGTPDKYEIQFSDKKIESIRNLGWCFLINEGDLNNDGSDEITVYSTPENGCIGYATTYTIKNKKSYSLINLFSVYSGDCDNEMSIELQDLVELNNGVVYYYEYNPDVEHSINRRGKKLKFAKKVKLF